MKGILAALALIIAGQAYAGDPTVGHIYLIDQEIELYDNGDGCVVPFGERKEVGGMRLSRYPSGQRDKYVMGCWKPIDSERFRAVFEDGVTMILKRSQLVPLGQESSRFSL